MLHFLKEFNFDHHTLLIMSISKFQRENSLAISFFFINKSDKTKHAQGSVLPFAFRFHIISF